MQENFHYFDSPEASPNHSPCISKHPQRKSLAHLVASRAISETPRVRNTLGDAHSSFGGTIDLDGTKFNLGSEVFGRLRLDLGLTPKITAALVSSTELALAALGKTTINVVADKKPYPFEFRIKKIPDPVFKIGSGKARVPAVEFKNQQFCRADLENFDFDLKFNIVSATVYFSGANFPNVTPFSLTGNNLSGMQSLMSRAGPGTSITFTSVKVQGPDGVRTIDERGITLY